MTTTTGGILDVDLLRFEQGDSGSRAPTPSKASVSFEPILRVLEFLIEDGALVTQGFQSGRSGVSLDGLDLAFRNLQFQPGAITPLVIRSGRPE